MKCANCNHEMFNRKLFDSHWVHYRTPWKGGEELLKMKDCLFCDCNNPVPKKVK